MGPILPILRPDELRHLVEYVDKIRDTGKPWADDWTELEVYAAFHSMELACQAGHDFDLSMELTRDDKEALAYFLERANQIRLAFGPTRKALDRLRRIVRQELQ